MGICVSLDSQGLAQSDGLAYYRIPHRPDVTWVNGSVSSSLRGEDMKGLSVLASKV